MASAVLVIACLGCPKRVAVKPRAKVTGPVTYKKCTVYFDEFHAAVIAAIEPGGVPAAIDKITFRGDEDEVFVTTSIKTGAVPESPYVLGTIESLPSENLAKLKSSDATSAVVVVQGDEVAGHCNIVPIVDILGQGYDNCPNCVTSYLCVCLREEFGAAPPYDVCNEELNVSHGCPPLGQFF